MAIDGRARNLSAIKWSPDGGTLAGLDATSPEVVFVDGDRGIERGAVAVRPHGAPTQLRWISGTDLRIESVLAAVRVDPTTGKVEELSPGFTAPDGQVRAEVTKDAVIFRRGATEVGRFSAPGRLRGASWAEDGSYFAVSYDHSHDQKASNATRWNKSFSVLDDNAHVLWTSTETENIHSFCGSPSHVLANGVFYEARSGRRLSPALPVPDGYHTCAWDATGRFLALRTRFAGLHLIDTETRATWSWEPTRLPSGPRVASGVTDTGYVRQNEQLIDFRPKHEEVGWSGGYSGGVRVFTNHARPIRDLVKAARIEVIADPHTGNGWALALGSNVLHLRAGDGEQNLLSSSVKRTHNRRCSVAGAEKVAACAGYDEFELFDLRTRRTLGTSKGTFVGWDRAGAVSLSGNTDAGMDLVLTDATTRREVSRRHLAFPIDPWGPRGERSAWSATAGAGVVCGDAHTMWLPSITAAPIVLGPGACDEPVRISPDGSMGAVHLRVSTKTGPTNFNLGGTLRDDLLVISMKSGKVLRTVRGASDPVFHPIKRLLAYTAHTPWTAGVGGAGDYSAAQNVHLLDLDRDASTTPSLNASHSLGFPVGQGRAIAFSGAVVASGETLALGAMSYDGTVAFVPLQGGNGWTAPAGHVVGVDVDRRIVAYEVGEGVRFVRETGEQITITNVGNDWIAYDGIGRFDGPEPAFANLRYRLGPDHATGHLITAEQLFDRMHAPGLVRDFFTAPERLHGVPVAALVGLPPELEWTATPPMAVDTDKLDVLFRVHDRGGGLGELRVFVNGARVPLLLRELVDGGDTRKLRVTVPLQSGDNKVAVEAMSDVGAVRSERLEARVFARLADDRRPTLRLVAISINDYEEPNQRLSYPNLDADAIVGAFRKQSGMYEDVVVTRLRDADVTREKVTRALEATAATAHPGDVLVVYAAGHGALARCDGEPEARYRFLTYDSSLRSDKSMCARAVSDLGLAELIRQVRVNKKLVVLDTCHAGSAASGATLFAMRGDSEQHALQDFARREGIAVLAAAQASELAGEVRELGHGIFTHALLEGLGGAAARGRPMVTVSGLLEYLEDTVPALSRRYLARAQYPVKSMQGQDFPLARR